MLSHNFLKHLKEAIIISSFNNFTGNNRHYPDFMYDDYNDSQCSGNEDSQNIPHDVDIDGAKITFGFDIEPLAETYNHISDVHSQELFLKLIIFKIFGPTKVKLPLTDYSLFNDFFAVQKVKKNITSAINSENNFHDLSTLGISLKIFYDSYGIFITFFRKQYEYGNIKPKEGDYVIDGGACLGDTALYFAHAVGEKGKVFSFEFIPSNVQAFEENTALNPHLANRISLTQAPLWKDSCHELFIIENGAASYCVDEEPAHYTNKVQSISIDDFVEKNALTKIDFIKFDIEGAEPSALLGAVKTIQKFTPNLAICIYHDFAHFHEIPKIIKNILPEYQLYIDHHSIHLGETVLYASIHPAQKHPLENTVEQADIVVIDSILPNNAACGLRNAEAIEFSRQLKDFAYYSMFPLLPEKKAWFTHGYGMTKRAFDINLQKHLKNYPEMQNIIKYLHPDKKYSFNLVFSYFVAETYTLLPFFKKHAIPFAFLLAPGGAFGFENTSSDAMLKEIVDSGLCKKIFVYHKKIGDYLVNKGICTENLIHFDPLGTLHFTPENIRPKRYYKKDKQTFDICFMAFKYTQHGVDKGYDIFIDVAKKLAKLHQDIHFHVVGDFTAEDIDISDIKDRISFRKPLLPRFLPAFYANMDINLSPNRPFKIYHGSFDGFPLGSTALYCGVCGFNTDPLGLNTEYVDREDLIIIQPNAQAIIRDIEFYYNNIEELYRVSRNGQAKALTLLDTKKCISNRIEVLKQLKNNA